jgi:hypothetical protein
MQTKLLRVEALAVINQYQNFNIGSAVCSIPYFNNSHMRLRGGLRAQVGKGDPKDILEEAGHIAIPRKINLKALDSMTLKKFLVDNNIGIDCSGFAYYVLDAESKARGKGSLRSHITFINGSGIIRKILNKLYPEKNVGAITLADNKNSSVIALHEVEAGDIITMIGDLNSKIRDHVIIIHEVERRDGVPSLLHYTHSIAWPQDGEYGHGVRQGTIKITDAEKPLTEQEWIEANATGIDNYTLTRARESKTEIRRLNWF